MIHTTHTTHTGCVMTAAGCVGGIGTGLLSDKLAGRSLKSMIITCLVLAAVGFAWMSLTLLEYIPGSKLSVYCAGVVSGLFVNAPIPLFFELAVETAYPVIPEGATCGGLTLVLTLVQVMFLAVSSVMPSSDATEVNQTAWMNWLLMIASPAAAACLALFKVEYARLDADEGL